LDVLATQRLTHIVQFLRILQGQIGRPTFANVNQLDINFGYVLPFAYKLCVKSLVHSGSTHRFHLIRHLTRVADVMRASVNVHCIHYNAILERGRVVG
jgi:hypothetical protein